MSVPIFFQPFILPHTGENIPNATETEKAEVENERDDLGERAHGRLSWRKAFGYQGPIPREVGCIRHAAGSKYAIAATFQ